MADSTIRTGSLWSAHTADLAALGEKARLRGIRPPTVPQGTNRLRISLTLNATHDDVNALAAALQQALR